jgi:uncharacterized protein (TIGR02301 family)
LALTALLVLAASGATAAEKAKQPAPDVPPPPPPVAVEQSAPYDKDLLRLSEILGSVHYLRSLCKPDMDDPSRGQMERLLQLEAGKEPERRQKLTAAFNRGYRSFAALHSTCTATALAAEARYRAEGATLATEITARFGN